MKDLMRVEEVSEEIGTPVGTLAYWRHVGSGPRWAKLGRRVVYRRRDLEAWIDNAFEATEHKATA
ncbi:helix-turn-helix transcriptional regulator [Isoptericola sp. G70]|uniref:helix-turn-helix transcriptional regulator n=1 Tax=Isoptericola sp. G70 TaxID=3376633 RepID=UPI003A7F9BED